MSVTLPRALRPWTEPLALFGEVVHDGVGRWLHPLRSLMGPLSVPHSAAAGEPDGYCGLTRRASGRWRWRPPTSSCAAPQPRSMCSSIGPFASPARPTQA
jgi:hypothetical protein